MQLTNSLLHALLVACDQSYQDTLHGGAAGTLAPFGDSGQANPYVADTQPNAMPTSQSKGSETFSSLNC